MKISKRAFGISLSVFFIITASVVTFTDADSVSNAIEFNNKIIDNQAKIINEIDNLELRLVTANSRKEAEREVRASILEVENIIFQTKSLDYPNSADSYKSTALELFEEYKSILGTVYKDEVIDLYMSENMDNEMFQEEYDKILTEANSDIKEIALIFQEEQRTFAHENNITIISTDPKSN